jgi:hypothetical protein
MSFVPDTNLQSISGNSPIRFVLYNKFPQTAYNYVIQQKSNHTFMIGALEMINLISSKENVDFNKNLMKLGGEMMENVSDSKSMPTFEEIRNAIPSHCFEKNLALSIFYFLTDYVILICLFYIVPYVENVAGLTGLFIWLVFKEYLF